MFKRFCGKIQIATVFHIFKSTNINILKNSHIVFLSNTLRHEKSYRKIWRHLEEDFFLAPDWSTSSLQTARDSWLANFSRQRPSSSPRKGRCSSWKNKLDLFTTYQLNSSSLEKRNILFSRCNEDSKMRERGTERQTIGWQCGFRRRTFWSNNFRHFLTKLNILILSQSWILLKLFLLLWTNKIIRSKLKPCFITFRLLLKTDSFIR